MSAHTKHKGRRKMYYNEELIFATGGRSNYRIPSMIVTNKGTVMAFCNDRKDTVSDHSEEVSLVLMLKKPGEPWSKEITLAGMEGWNCGIGSACYDNEIGRAFIFGSRSSVTKQEFKDYTPEEMAAMKKKAEDEAAKLGIRLGAFTMYSDDEGETWGEYPFKVETTEFTHWDGSVSMITGGVHGSAHGIQLRHGEHKGRLLCPSRMNVKKYKDMHGLRRHSYNNAIYSDDHGKTWKASLPVQVGTGEGTLTENADGSITYNSRAYFQDGKRYIATSTDGGESYGSFRIDNFLREEKNIGCNASFIRVERDEIKDASLLPDGCDGITVFCNPRADTRRNMTACISFDGGETWSAEKTIYSGPAAYSSLVFSPTDQHFHLIYEKGDDEKGANPCTLGIAAAEFDIEWLLSK